MLFPLVKEQGGAPGRLQVQEVGGTFPRKITIGDPTKDSQDFLSTWIISDLSGGHGLANHQTDATVNRYRYATMDVTRPNMWTQRPKVNEETGTAAAFWPLGDLLVGGTINFYGAFGTDLHVWNESTDAWTDTTRNLGSAESSGRTSIARVSIACAVSRLPCEVSPDSMNSEAASMTASRLACAAGSDVTVCSPASARSITRRLRRSAGVRGSNDSMLRVARAQKHETACCFTQNRPCHAAGDPARRLSR